MSEDTAYKLLIFFAAIYENLMSIGVVILLIIAAYYFVEFDSFSQFLRDNFYFKWN